MTERAFLGGKVVLHPGDCVDVLASLPENSVDSVVCDPPYHLGEMTKRYGKPDCKPCGAGKDGSFRRLSKGFMGKAWDGGDVAFQVETWAEVLRVLKPGGHLLAFSGTRTYHRMVCAIEDAGFEIRDQIGWAYGSGFPKSHDVSKGIDKAFGGADYERQKISLSDHIRACRKRSKVSRADLASWFPQYSAVTENWERNDAGKRTPSIADYEILVEKIGCDPAYRSLVRQEAEREVIGRSTNGLAQDWVANGDAGFKKDFDVTAPATDAAKQWEGWGTALKPAWEPIVLARKPLIGTVAANVLQFGTGAINVDGCRVEGAVPLFSSRGESRSNSLGDGLNGSNRTGEVGTGRWPANIVHDGSQEVLAAFPDAEGQLRPVTGMERSMRTLHAYGDFGASRTGAEPRGDSGSAARFFYQVKEDDRWPLSHEPASTVEPSFSLSSEAAVSALSDAVARSMPGVALNSQSYLAPSTTVTATECGWIAMLVTETIQSIGRRSWRGPPPERLSLADSLASIVATQKQTGIITITISLSKLNGSAAPVTFDVTVTNSELGASDSPLKRLHYTSKADAEDRLGSKHPTVKPVDLMQWLVRLVCPRGGTVLDPFAGTGTTGEAAWREGMRAILIEREAEYQADIARRMELAANPTKRSAVAKTKNKLDRPEDLPLFAPKEAAE